jgi:hypothetical protein
MPALIPGFHHQDAAAGTNHDRVLTCRHRIKHSDFRVGGEEQLTSSKHDYANRNQLLREQYSVLRCVQVVARAHQMKIPLSTKDTLAQSAAVARRRSTSEKTGLSIASLCLVIHGREGLTLD